MSTLASTFGCSGARSTAGCSWSDPDKAIRSFSMDVKVPLTVNGPATCTSAAVSGVGLTYNIASIVEPLVRQGLLEPCLEGFMPESRGLFIYFPSRKQMLPKLRAFVEFWKEFGGRQIGRL